jgi:hypothetical protein
VCGETKRFAYTVLSTAPKLASAVGEVATPQLSPFRDFGVGPPRPGSC